VGYILSPDENAVVAADEIAEMTINNLLQRGDLKIIKTFEGKSTPIKGVKFTVTGTSIAGIPFEGTFRTDENGEIFIEGLPIGEYTVREIASKLTAGYVLSEEQNAAVAADEIAEMTIDNKLVRGNIRILKTDAETGKPLAGAVFGLYQGDVLIAEQTTGEDGYAVFEDVAYGNYTVREINAPEGYKEISKAFKVKIRENGETVELEIKNRKIPEKPFRPSIPKTGDDSNMALWLIVMGVSTAAIVGLTLAGKRRKTKKEAYGD